MTSTTGEVSGGRVRAVREPPLASGRAHGLREPPGVLDYFAAVESLERRRARAPPAPTARAPAANQSVMFPRETPPVGTKGTPGKGPRGLQVGWSAKGARERLPPARRASGASMTSEGVRVPGSTRSPVPIITGRRSGSQPGLTKSRPGLGGLLHLLVGGHGACAEQDAIAVLFVQVPYHLGSIGGW